MRILFLAHLFPLPLDSGGKIKSYYTLRALAARHEVRAIAFIRSDEEATLIPELTRVCAGVDVVRLERGRCRQARDLLGSLARGKSFIIGRDFRADMLNAVTRAVEEFRPDVVHIDHLQMAQYVDSGGPYRVVLDNHNVESMIIKRVAETVDVEGRSIRNAARWISSSLSANASPLQRFYAGLEWPKLQRYELATCRRCDLVLTVSEEDKATLQMLNQVQHDDQSLANVECVPIGVDVDHFRMIERAPGSLNVLSIGTMYWPPNVDSMLYFSRDILPLVREQIPDCTLTIAGQRPVESIQALGREPGITVTGYVDDECEVARDCGVFIVPLRSGSGVRVKILNALAMGLPVVSTSVGAEGLDVRSGEHLLIADGVAEFAQAVVKVLRDPELADRLGRNGRELVCEKYSWNRVGERLLGLYDKYLSR